MKKFDIFKILRIVFDFLSLILGFILSYWFRFYGGVIPIFHFPIPDFRHYFYAFTIVFFIALFVFYFTDLWKVEEKGFSFLDEVFEVLRALIILGIITTGISFFYRKILYARLVVIFFFLFTFILMLFFRGIIRILKKEFLKKGKGILRVLLIGEGEIGEWIERKIEEDKTLGYRIESNLSSEDFLKMDFKEFFYDLILIALPLEKQYLLKDIIKKCENFEIPIRIVPDIYQLMIGGAGIYNLAGMPILAIKEPRLTRFQAFLKRAFDLFFSLFIIILTLPIMAIIAILIKIQDKGPVFYLQERVGQDGKIFKLIKFRTMKVGADKE
ncbi:MAG: sugar transferase, partial [candidate division WOR-3 bacterium]